MMVAFTTGRDFRENHAQKSLELQNMNRVFCFSNFCDSGEAEYAPSVLAWIKNQKYPNLTVKGDVNCLAIFKNRLHYKS